MWRVYDAQGNYTFVHHFIDVKDYLKIGYVGYEKCNEGEVNKYSTNNHPPTIFFEERIKNNCGSKVFSKAEYKKLEHSPDPKTNSDILTVIGTASCVFEDIENYGVFGDIAVINDAAFYYPEFNHFITVHGKLIPIVKEYRKSFRSYYSSNFQTHSAVHRQCGLIPSDQSNADFLWEFQPIYRSSGLLAVWIGIALGYKKIIVHGVPFNGNHFYDFVDSHVKNQYEKFTKLVSDNKVMVSLMRKSNVRFSSGRLSELIGKPSESWINGN